MSKIVTEIVVSPAKFYRRGARKFRIRKGQIVRPQNRHRNNEVEVLDRCNYVVIMFGSFTESGSNEAIVAFPSRDAANSYFNEHQLGTERFGIVNLQED